MLADEFNRLTDHQRVRLLCEVCSSPSWARRVSDGAPFENLSALLAHAERVLAELPESEIDSALAGHPRIGGCVTSAEAAREQAGVAGAPDDVRAALAAQNRAYEDKFGYVYLVCADGRPAAQLLAILSERLHNDAETERRVMRMELAAINRIRLARLLSKEAS